MSSLNKKWIRVVGVILVATLTACASGPANNSKLGATPSNADEQIYAEQLEKGRALSKAGSQRKAIDDYYDPVLRHYDELYGSRKEKVYGARSPTESLFYLVTAASEKHAAIVVSYVWGEAHFLKAYALVELGDLAGAKKLLDRAVAISPKNATYLSELGNWYQTEKQWSSALETYQLAEAAADLSPAEIKTRDLTRAWRGIGFALSEQGKFTDAEGYYQRCLKENPNDSMAQNELKYIEQQRKKVVR